MLGLCIADAIRRFAEARNGAPEVITRQWTKKPYLTRWVVCSTRDDKNPNSVDRGKLILHRFQDSDADEPHNHPWNFVSLILSGGYWERTPARGWENGKGPTREAWYAPGRVLARGADHVHSVRLRPGVDCWTLVYLGPKIPNRPSWGFFCEQLGFVPWRKHLANYYRTGSGCAE